MITPFQKTLPLWASALWIACALASGAEAVGAVNVPAAETERVADPMEIREPMDETAAPAALARWLERTPDDWMLFVEDRAHPIRRDDAPPARWLEQPGRHTGTFRGEAQPGEFYVFQLGLYAARADVGPLAVHFENLEGIRCFNLGGTNHLGRPFATCVRVEQGRLQALWFGVDVPPDRKAPFAGSIVVTDTATGRERTVDLDLAVRGDPLADHGDGDAWRLSRLRWLDSSIGLEEGVVTPPYAPITRDRRALRVLGRDLELDENGLPARLRSRFDADASAIDPDGGRDLLAEPFRFTVFTDAGPAAFAPAALRFTEERADAVRWTSVSSAAGLTRTVEGWMEYDGFVEISVRLEASEAVRLSEVRLETEVAAGADTHFMGLGYAGGLRPERVDWRWNDRVHQDAFWIGAPNGGFKLQLLGANYRMPLVNAYYAYRPLRIPESWGGGGIRLGPAAGGTRIVAYSGPKSLAPGGSLDFRFRLLPTPVKPLATDDQWSLRYLHKMQGVEDEDYRDLRRVQSMGASVINIHHNKEQNPVINYPYYDASLPLLRRCVEDAHALGLRVKVYYTTREITCNLPELFAFRSLGDEIICASPGMDGKDARPITNPNGPHPWLLKHLGDRGYLPAWREVIRGRYGGLLDLAVITTPESRMENFYCEGLAYLLRQADIDGVYIDDTSLSRKGFQRAHRIFQAAGKRFLADLHSWNHHGNAVAGDTPSACLYLQNMPYVHRLWFGEGFSMDRPADQLLVAQSGLPFGVMAEMLQGPNPWRGMVFGETVRLGWSGNPRALWAFWDRVGMAGTTMSGWWNPGAPVRSDRPDVHATAYHRPGRVVVALASWSDMPERVTLAVDRATLGLAASDTGWHAPAIEGFQEEARFPPGAPIPVEPGRGWLLLPQETDASPRP